MRNFNTSHLIPFYGCWQVFEQNTYATGRVSISPELSRLSIPICTDTDWDAIACSIVAAELTGEEWVNVGGSSGLTAFVGLERNANTVKVTIHASRNPRSVQIKMAWDVASNASIVSPLFPFVMDEYVNSHVFL